MPDIICTIANRLRVYSAPNGSLSWQGDYEGMPVIALLAVKSNAVWIVLLEPSATKQPTFENLLCIAGDGHLIWKAELPSTHDCFVEVQDGPDGLIAATWSGYRVKLNPETGKIMERKFTK